MRAVRVRSEPRSEAVVTAHMVDLDFVLRAEYFVTVRVELRAPGIPFFLLKSVRGFRGRNGHMMPAFILTGAIKRPVDRCLSWWSEVAEQCFVSTYHTS